MTRAAIPLAILLTTQSALAGTIKVQGGAAAMENVFKRIAAPFEAATGIRLELTATQVVEAFKAVERGDADLAAVGLTFASWVESVEKEGHPVADKSQYKSRIIGRDRIQFIVNRNVKVAELSRAQVKDIFTGKITNWKAVGGPDLPVVVVLGSKIPGTNKVVQEQLLDRQEFVTKGVMTATDMPSVAAAVTSTSGAIGFGPAGTAGDFGSPRAPEVGRPITAVTKGTPSADVDKLYEFIRREGPKYVAH